MYGGPGSNGSIMGTRREMGKHGRTLGNTRVPQGWAGAGVGVGMLRGGGIPDVFRKFQRFKYHDRLKGVP